MTIVTGMAGYVPLVGEPLAALLRGGDDIGPATLGNYFALHTQWLPALLVGWCTGMATSVVLARGDALGARMAGVTAGGVGVLAGALVLRLTGLL